MEVWIPKATRKSAVLAFKELRDWDHFTRVWGERLSENWRPLKAYLGRGKPSHFVYLGSLLTCNDEAWQILKGPLSSDVEDLPILVDDAVYHILNVVSVLDCLDQQQSRFLRLPAINRINVLHYVFIEEALKGHMLFRVKEDPEFVFATSEFKSLIEKHKLKHIEFYKPLPTLDVLQAVLNGQH